MIPSLIIAALCAHVPTSTTSDEGLDRFRLPYERLMDRAIGSTSRPVRFDWRKTTVQVAAFAAQPAEFNNYNTFRAGLVARVPSDNLMVELGLSYAWVWGTEASRRLALTPYRQPARPPRIELDITIGLPIAEGVVTVRPSFIPAFELVFSGYVNFRYLIYPTGWRGVDGGAAAGAVFVPRLTDAEVASLDDARLPGMEVDRLRYYFLAGFGTELYFQHGLFIAPRVMLNIPVTAALSGSDMLFGFDFSLAVGVAF